MGVLELFPGHCCRLLLWLWRFWCGCRGLGDVGLNGLFVAWDVFCDEIKGLLERLLDLDDEGIFLGVTVGSQRRDVRFLPMK